MAELQESSVWRRAAESPIVGLVAAVGVGTLIAVIIAMRHDVRWLLIIVWLCAVVAIWEVTRLGGARTFLQRGIIAAGALLSGAALVWLYLVLAPVDSSSPPETTALTAYTDQPPNVLLLYQKDRLVLYNRGTYDLYLAGDKTDDTGVSANAQKRTIPFGGYYYFLTDDLKRWAIGKIGIDGESLISFDVYLLDKSNTKYVAKFGLLIKITSGEMDIHTQEYGVTKQDWSAISPPAASPPSPAPPASPAGRSP